MNHDRLPADARLLWSYRRAEMERTQAAILKAELDANPTEMLHREGPAGGDSLQLRGIPVVGGGMGGAIPGTNPASVCR